MNKEGESFLRRSAPHVAFIVFMVYVLGAFLMYPDYFSITGNAVLEDQDSVDSLAAIIETSHLFQSTNSISMCITINGENTSYIKINKQGSTVNVEPSEYLCGRNEIYDYNIAFINKNAFDDVMADFNVATLMSGKGGNKFYILPSRYVKAGGDIVCDADFKERFCDSASNLGTIEELIAGDLYCCVNDLTRTQQRLLSDHLETSGFSNEAPILELPAETSSLGTYAFMAIIGILFILGAGVVLVRNKVTGSNHASFDENNSNAFDEETNVQDNGLSAQSQEDPRVTQLREYIRTVLVQGYTKEQVLEYLMSLGWGREILEPILNEQ